MRHFLIAAGIVCALALASDAWCAWPSNTRLNTTESAIAGKPVTVFCASTAQEWDTWVRTAYKGTRTGTQVAGYSYAGGNAIYLSNILCSTAFYAMRVGWGKARAFYLGALIDVMSHEPNHTWGLVNEADTEACAHRYYALTIHDLFGVKYHTSAMRLMVSFATAYAKGLPPAYQGGTCPR